MAEVAAQVEHQGGLSRLHVPHQHSTLEQLQGVLVTEVHQMIGVHLMIEVRQMLLHVLALQLMDQGDPGLKWLYIGQPRFLAVSHVSSTGT